MSSIQRKFAVLFGTALAVTAIVAVPASATVDFPHEESGSAWTAIQAIDYNGSINNALPCDAGAAEAADCSFTSSTSGAGWTFYGIVSWGGYASWTGDLGKKGEFVVTKHSGLPGSSGTYSGLICRHTGTNEYWVRVTESGSSVVMFGQVVADPSGLGTSTATHNPRQVVLGSPEDRAFTTIINGPSWSSYFSARFASMWDEKEVLIGQADEAAPCAWPELS